MVYDVGARCPVEWAKVANDEMLRLIVTQGDVGLAAIEMVASYGMAVGATVFETVWWSGRFTEAWAGWNDGLPIRVYRKDVKLHLCGSVRAKDTNIRQALIDRYGPGRNVAVGRKDSPGPLYGFKADCWQALGVAITACEVDLTSAGGRERIK